MEMTILLATDLDRTLLPNGEAVESPEARARFRRFAALPEVILVFVTGRHRALIEQAMAEYALPPPDYVIGDVGTSLYAVRNGEWLPEAEWFAEIAMDWIGSGHTVLAEALSGIADLRLQEAEKQGSQKLSYYAPPLADPTALLERVHGELARTGAHYRLVWSVDEVTGTGLLDVLPASASKHHALEFLRRKLDIPLNRTVFAGDSGNDMEVLISDIPSVLVANAQQVVRDEAVARSVTGGHGAALYLAHGGLAGMNGNYSAGILEGVAHFIPATRAWLEV